MAGVSSSSARPYRTRGPTRNQCLWKSRYTSIHLADGIKACQSRRAAAGGVTRTAAQGGGGFELAAAEAGSKRMRAAWV